jgi:hypothetical protein
MPSRVRLPRRLQFSIHGRAIARKRRTGISILWQERWSRDLEAHHGQVVVGFSTIAMLFYFGSKGINDLLRCIELGIAENGYQSVVAKLLLLEVFCLVQSIGVDE